MILPVYSIYDVKARAYQQPAISSNDETVKRAFFENLVNGSDRIMRFQPSDFQLFKIGEFDVEKGILIPKVPNELIATGNEVLGYGRSEEE